MKKELLIELIQELHQRNLLPSKLKTEMLINFNDSQVAFLENLLSAGLIQQSNLNYVVGEISKIKGSFQIDQMVLSHVYLYFEDLNRYLKWILHSLQKNANKTYNYMQKLFKCVTNDNGYIANSMLLDMVENKKINDLNLADSILNVCQIVYDRDFPIEVISKLKQIALNDQILNLVKQNDHSSRKSYQELLENFREIINNATYFNETYALTEHLLEKKKVKCIGDLSCLIEKLAQHDSDYYDFHCLETVLLEYCPLEQVNVDALVYDVGAFSCDKNDDKNEFLTLTQLIFQQVSKEKVTAIYNLVLDTVSNIPCWSFHTADETMQSILDMMQPILTNQNFLDYLNQDGKLDILYIFISNINDLSLYPKKSFQLLNNQELSFDTYSKILSSFSVQESRKIFKAKQTIYNNQQVLDLIEQDSSILKRMNYILLENRNLGISQGEISLYQNPTFLKSQFFAKKYYPFLKNSGILLKGVVFQNNFYEILNTCDFEDPNLLFYMQTLLNSDYDAVDLGHIYGDILAKKKEVLVSVKDSIYEILASKDSEQVNSYLALLEASPSNFDIKADTPIIYQKNKRLENKKLYGGKENDTNK